jgi:hypothetical protein
MRQIAGLSLVALLFVIGCTRQQNYPPEGPGQVRYFDRNGDGKVDRETHHYPGVADADWELRDDNDDGRYEKKILHGFGVQESVVDIAVPSGVKIEKGP